MKTTKTPPASTVTIPKKKKLPTKTMNGSTFDPKKMTILEGRLESLEKEKREAEERANFLQVQINRTQKEIEGRELASPEAEKVLNGIQCERYDYDDYRIDEISVEAVRVFIRGLEAELELAKITRND